MSIKNKKVPTVVAARTSLTKNKICFEYSKKNLGEQSINTLQKNLKNFRADLLQLSFSIHAHELVVACDLLLNEMEVS